VQFVSMFTTLCHAYHVYITKNYQVILHIINKAVVANFPSFVNSYNHCSIHRTLIIKLVEMIFFVLIYRNKHFVFLNYYFNNYLMPNDKSLVYLNCNKNIIYINYI
jgi:hypothetical protein